MPPKLPNMKFRPKSDPRVKIEEEDDDELLATLQRERMEQQTAQTHQSHAAAATAPPPPLPAEGSVRSRPNPPTRTNAGGSRASNRKESAISAALETTPTEMVLSSAADEILRSAPLLDTALQSAVSSATGEALIRPAPLSMNFSAQVKVEGGGEMGPRQQTEDGVAFLEQSRFEQDSIWALNSSLLLDGSSPFRNPDGSLVWFQLPKPAAAAVSEHSLQSLGTGKVGKMVVYKSGRTVLVINGTEFEVAMSRESSAQFATTILSNQAEGAVCYELGQVLGKAVCTPSVV
jgi:hypothetical protein